MAARRRPAASPSPGPGLKGRILATLLCVHPHPDDESIATGGLLARAVDEGHDVVVVTCTGGEEGENLAGIDLGDESLAAHRQRELADALDALGVGRHVRLGYRDSGMVGSPGNDHPASFHQASLEEAAARVAAEIRRFRPQVVVSDDANGTYGHPDHIKAHHVTRRALALAADPAVDGPERAWSVPRWFVHSFARGRLHELHRTLLDAGLVSPFGAADVDAELPFGVDDERIDAVVDVVPWLDRKRAAMAAHRSQIGEDSFFLNTPPHLAQAVFGVEQFVLVAGDPLADRPVDDLFAGLALDERPVAAG